MTISRRLFSRLSAVVAGAFLSGCGREAGTPAPAASDETPPSATSSTGHGGALRFLALGDSYTIGEGVQPDRRWPVQLAAALRSGGLDVGDPQIIARTGWRTDDLDAAITRADPKGPFQLVSLLIGVNNQYQGRPPDEGYRAEVDGLLRRAIIFAAGEPSRVLLLSIPDWGATPFGRSADRARVAGEIDAFNAANRAEAVKAGVRYVDITPVSRNRAELVADDGLHPSSEMYAEWVRLALPEAIAALGGAATARPASPPVK